MTAAPPSSVDTTGKPATRPGAPSRIIRLTLDERVARGRAARNECPRSSHGRWEPAGGRLDPIALLEEQAATRLPELVPIRYGRMLASPFTFYRGAALIMASDLAPTPRSGLRASSVGTPTCRTSACSPLRSGS